MSEKWFVIAGGAVTNLMCYFKGIAPDILCNIQIETGIDMAKIINALVMGLLGGLAAGMGRWLWCSFLKWIKTKSDVL